MKVMVAALVLGCLVAGGGAQRQKGGKKQVSLPQASLQELQAILSTEPNAVQFVDCLIGTKKQATQACINRDARSMRRFAPFIIRARGDCDKLPARFKCTEADKKNIVFVTKQLSNVYPDQYLRLQRYLNKSL